VDSGSERLRELHERSPSLTLGSFGEVVAPAWSVTHDHAYAVCRNLSGCKRSRTAIRIACRSPPEGETMIVLRFRAQCKPEQIDEALSAFRQVVTPSRELQGVISFDVAQDVTDPNTVIAVEVFEDQAALDRQESLAEVANVMSILPGALAAPPEATVFHVSTSQSRF
jgi:quinol monooxygenase YgiN